ncbi:MAG TPA: enolase C-terminal domain-like protein [Burkholderiales bacterium]|nr:enolase C-terminal domain-like protein [Burkholderiales bacterium]
MAPRLTVKSLRARAVSAPMKHVLGTSAAKVTAAPLLLFDLETDEGITGRAYQFCYVATAARAIQAILDDAIEAIRGRPVAPQDIRALLAKRYTLIGVQGVVRMAMALIDVAAWDALARAAGVPLAACLGATPRPIPAYNSNGLGLMAAGALADEAEALVEEGFSAVKLRLGYATLEQDLAALHAVRKRVGERVTIMTDYNQALTVPEAIARGRALDREGVYWLEEPIRHDDYAGCAALAAEIATPVQIGENFSTVYDMQKALAANACDYAMPDLERIGGVTGWLQAAGLAYARGLPMSSHLYPEVSVHLLAATPTAHWLEYVDWLGTMVREPLRIVDGHAVPPDRPGNGIEWDEDAVRRYALT